MANNSLPRTEREWWTAARRQHVQKQSLWQNLKLHSGSRISYKQYLLFRTICPRMIPQSDLNVQHLGITQQRMQQANAIVQDPAFGAYLTDIIVRRTLGGDIPTWTGGDRLFRIPAIQQQQVLRNHIRGETEETSVNTSLISFLQALTDMIPQATCQWTAVRTRLTADFSAERRDRQFVAVTDGQLMDFANRRMSALIECKRNLRADRTSIEMQEIAQMVAWVRQYPGNHRRTMVSQDNIQVFISIFTYSQGWLRYLGGGNGSIRNAGFAYMQRFGPWNINVAGQMQDFCRIVSALLLL